MKILITLITSILITTSAFAISPLPTNLIALASPEGTQLFNESKNSDYFWRLNLQFVSQDNLAYCSIASSVMVLNALQVPAPLDTAHPPYKLFTQDNFFTDGVTKVLPASLVKKQGATLEQIGQALKTFPIQVQIIHANELSENKFRTLAMDTIKNRQGYLIINFVRTGLFEQGGGHMSPLIAYNKKTDRFLMLDVARYRYPSAWVKTQDLWNAMHTIDQSAKAYRGLIIISKK